MTRRGTRDCCTARRRLTILERAADRRSGQWGRGRGKIADLGAAPVHGSMGPKNPLGAPAGIFVGKFSGAELRAWLDRMGWDE